MPKCIYGPKDVFDGSLSLVTHTLSTWSTQYQKENWLLVFIRTYQIKVSKVFIEWRWLKGREKLHEKLQNTIQIPH